MYTVQCTQYSDTFHSSVMWIFNFTHLISNNYIAMWNKNKIFNLAYAYLWL